MDTRPPFDTGDAGALARSLYGLEAEASELPSERDRNFRLEAGEGRRLLLKIAAADEAAAVRDLQTQALRHALQADELLPIPRPVPTLEGAVEGSVQDGEGRSYSVRALSWLEGRVLAEVRPRRLAIDRQLGQVLGRLDRALEGFEHPAMDHALDWNLRRGLEVVPGLLEGLAGEARDRALRLLERLRPRLEAAAPDLRTGLVHHDAHDHNVLVDDRPGQQSVAGLLDFGDMGRSWIASEAAVAIAYAMMGRRDPLAAAGAVVQGYQQHHPLREDELEVLGDLATLRVLTSVGMAARQRAAQPGNAYLSISEDAARALMQPLESIDPQRFAARMRDAAGFPASRRDAKVRAHLRQAPAAPVLDPGIELGAALELDLSVASADLAELGPDLDEPRLSAWIERRMQETGAPVAWGRYDEPRVVYTAPGFEVAADEGEAARTIHLGVDLFLPAGAAVHAPYDGVVHSFADNALALDYGPTILLEHRTEGGTPFFTLYGHLSRESLEGLEVDAPVRAGQPIATLGRAEVNGGWPPHLHLQVISELHGARGDFPGVAPADERGFWTSLCPDPAPMLGRARPEPVPHASTSPHPPTSPLPSASGKPLPAGGADDAKARPCTTRATASATEDLLRRRQRCMPPSLGLSYSRPLHIVRGAGAHLFDAEGRRYLDAVNNVPHVGHCHPRVVRALRRQAATLATNTRYLYPQLVEFAERLLAKAPPSLEVCFLVSSGSEANELALRLARTHTGGQDVIVLDGAYHGNTGQLVDLSPYKCDGPGGQGTPDWVQVLPMPDPYRGLYRHDQAEAGRLYAEHMHPALRAIAESGGRPAAFLAEPLLGCGGQIVPPEGFLPRAFQIAREAGAVCIADEVQVGFGRVGTHFWAFEALGAVPDVVSLGKPIGNGHPLGAVLCTRAIAESFATGMEYFNTFGGNPVSCAVGMAVLDVIEDEGLQAQALRVGQHLLEGLRALQPRFPLIGEIRGLGMYLGIELVRDHQTLEPADLEAAHIAERMKDHGILISTDGPLHNVLKIKPPLVFGDRDAQRLLSTLEKVLGESCLQAGSS